MMRQQPPEYGQPYEQPPSQYYGQLPQPQYSQPWHPPLYQPPQKKASRLWLWIILGVVAVLLLGCIGIFTLVGAAATSATSTISATTTVASSGNAPGSSQTGKVGQTITLDNVATTLVSVKTLAADDFIKPKPGNEFIVVHVKIANNSTAEQDYNPFDFHARSGSGNITDEEIPPSSYTSNNTLSSGKLSPGGTVEGDIVFQVPKNDHQAQLTWQPSFFGNAGDNGWNLGL
ncbi:MAG: DUF4352 domain-containing protein [Chloroflexota bacterium]|nr:DUF4352 domain-containing protein [Chloroflexota bacterium]